MNTLGTSYGLSWISGINPYAPLLALAVAARWYGFPINPHVAFLTQDFWLILLVVLLVLDFFIEKIPIVDHLWHAVHTLIRPLVGALIMQATYTSVPPLEHLALIASGLVISMMVHLAKWTLRIMATIGCGAPLISMVENIFTLIIIVLSFVDPMLMLAWVLIFTLLFLYFLPTIISTFCYQLRVTWGLIEWIFGRNTRLDMFNVSLHLSERERKHLQERVPLHVQIRTGLRLLWWRRKGIHWLSWWWGNQRVATPTWLLFTDESLILLPSTQQNMIELVLLNRKPNLVATRGLLKGSLKITVPYSPQTQHPQQVQPQIQVYEFTVLRPDWSALKMLVQPFQTFQVILQ